MILRLVIADGSQSPPVAESVELTSDGAISGWRTVSDGGVGWFAGVLPAEELAEVQRLVTAVGSTPPGGSPRPDSGQAVLELVATGPVSIAGLRAGTDDWSRLATVSRELLDRLTDFPRAAVTVSYPAPLLARLSHRGSDPLRADLSRISVGAVAWHGYYSSNVQWDGLFAGPGEIDVEPGWSYDLPLKLEAAEDDVVHLNVDFAILNGTTRIPVRAKHTPAIPPPLL